MTYNILQITWLDGTDQVIKSAEGDDPDPSIVTETEDIDNTKRVTTISTLTMTAKKADHNTTITCQVKLKEDLIGVENENV